MDMFDSLYDYVYLSLCLSGIITITSLTFITLFYVIIKSRAAAVKKSQPDGEVSVGFFHPYCNSGGGGERVLWQAVKVTQARYPAAKIVIYTGDVDAAPDMILNKARDRFNMTISDRNLQFVYLHKRR